MIQLHGVIPPIITPFNEAGEVDIIAHRQNLKRWNGEKLAGYLVLGSNGETPYLHESEKLILIESTVEHAELGRTIMAGTGLEGTRETIRFTNLAAEHGAQCALVLSPCFYKSSMSESALIRHYMNVADASRIPVLLYSVPAYTQLPIPEQVVAKVSHHPNILGMKDSAGDVPRLALLKQLVPASFQLIVGSASAWYPALELGIRAGILALANIAGNRCAEVQALFEGGKKNEARQLHDRLVPVNRAITSAHGIAGLKYAASLLGYDGCRLRLPLLPLDPSAEQQVRGVLAEAGLM